MPGPVITAPSSPVPSTTPRLPTAAASDDPETFARGVAAALFGWDTATGFMPLDYTSVILEVGDPSGAEQAGLASDTAAYIQVIGTAMHPLRPDLEAGFWYFFYFQTERGLAGLTAYRREIAEAIWRRNSPK